MPQSMILDEAGWRENQLLARLAKRAVILADRASAVYSFGTTASYGGAVPTTTVGWSGQNSAAYSFETAASYGGAVPTTTVGWSGQNSAAYSFETAASCGSAVPTATTTTMFTTLVGQALSACAIGAKVFADESPAAFAPSDYASAPTQAPSWLLDLQLSMQHLTTVLVEVKEACQPLLGQDVGSSTNEATAELEHAASLLRDFYERMGRNSPQIAILLALLTVVIAILAWLYPRSSGGTTIQIEQVIQPGAHICDNGMSGCMDANYWRCPVPGQTVQPSACADACAGQP
jgi:hypothetical protein